MSAHLNSCHQPDGVRSDSTAGPIDGHDRALLRDNHPACSVLCVAGDRATGASPNLASERPLIRPLVRSSRPGEEEGDAMTKSTLGVLLLLLGCVSAFSRQPPRNPAGQAAAGRNPAGTLRQIIPGHYVYSSATYNSGIIVTSEGVIVLDAVKSQAAAWALTEA